jgi:nicotinamide mononucleotide adenylyltransferase
MRRRGARHAFGYGSDSARETMTDEVTQAERRWTMLDRLLAALKIAKK